MVENILLNGGVAIVTAFVSSITTFLITKKKYNSEVDANVIDNMTHSLDFYKTLADDNKSRLEELTKRNDSLEKEVQELKNNVFALTMNICMDLTCQHRIKDNLKTIKHEKDNKSKN